jgi:hypothetical protein
MITFNDVHSFKTYPKHEWLLILPTSACNLHLNRTMADTSAAAIREAARLRVRKMHSKRPNPKPRVVAVDAAPAGPPARPTAISSRELLARARARAAAAAATTKPKAPGHTRGTARRARKAAQSPPSRRAAGGRETQRRETPVVQGKWGILIRPLPLALSIHPRRCITHAQRPHAAQGVHGRDVGSFKAHRSTQRAYIAYVRRPGYFGGKSTGHDGRPETVGPEYLEAMQGPRGGCRSPRLTDVGMALALDFGRTRARLPLRIRGRWKSVAASS